MRPWRKSNQHRPHRPPRFQTHPPGGGAPSGSGARPTVRPTTTRSQRGWRQRRGATARRSRSWWPPATGMCSRWPCGCAAPRTTRSTSPRRPTCGPTAAWTSSGGFQVFHVDVPHHGQLRAELPEEAVATSPRGVGRTPRAGRRRAKPGPGRPGREHRASRFASTKHWARWRPSCERSWCFGTSTICPTTTSPQSWAFRCRPPRCACTGRDINCATSCCRT